jgi:hypothetical protein
MRDLDFLRDDHRAPIAYDDARKWFRLTRSPIYLATSRRVNSTGVSRKFGSVWHPTQLTTGGALDLRARKPAAGRN